MKFSLAINVFAGELFAEVAFSRDLGCAVFVEGESDYNFLLVYDRHRLGDLQK